MTEQTPTGEEAPLEDTSGGEELGSGRGHRAWRVAAVVGVLAAASSLGVLGSLLLGVGGGATASDVLACVPDRDFTKPRSERVTCPPKGAPHVDGFVGDDIEGGIELRTVDGETRTYVVREPDRPYIDLQHARTHAALGQPVRLYTREVDGERVVVYMVDAPLGF